MNDGAVPTSGNTCADGTPWQPSTERHLPTTSFAAMEWLTPPRPCTFPPLNGTSGSAVPCASKTDTGRDGLQGTPAPSVPAIGAIAATRSARSQASLFDMKPPLDMPVAKTCPGAMLYSLSSLPASAAKTRRRRHGGDRPVTPPPVGPALS